MPLHVPAEPHRERGQVLLSVAVLRPGDPPPTIPSSSAAVGDAGGAVLRIPPARHRPFHLNVLVYRGEGLHLGQRPFVSVRFNGNTVRTATRAHQANPIFNRRFEMPFYLPVASDAIEVMLWDEGRRGRPDRLVAAAAFSQNDLNYKPWGPRWICFYADAPVHTRARTGGARHRARR